MDGDIDIEVRNNRIYLSVVNDDDDNEELRHLVGRHGEGSGGSAGAGAPLRPGW